MDSGVKMMMGSQAMILYWRSELGRMKEKRSCPTRSLQAKVATKHPPAPRQARRKVRVEFFGSREAKRGSPRRSIIMLMMGSVKRKCFSERVSASSAGFCGLCSSRFRSAELM